MSKENETHPLITVMWVVAILGIAAAIWMG